MAGKLISFPGVDTCFLHFGLNSAAAVEDLYARTGQAATTELAMALGLQSALVDSVVGNNTRYWRQNLGGVWAVGGIGVYATTVAAGETVDVRVRRGDVTAEVNLISNSYDGATVVNYIRLTGTAGPVEKYAYLSDKVAVEGSAATVFVEAEKFFNLGDQLSVTYQQSANSAATGLVVSVCLCRTSNASDFSTD